MMARGLYDPNAARHLSPIIDDQKRSTGADDAILTSPLTRARRRSSDAQLNRETDLILSPEISKGLEVGDPMLDTHEEITILSACEQITSQDDSDSAPFPSLLSSPSSGPNLELKNFKDSEIDLIGEESGNDLDDMEFLTGKTDCEDEDLLLHMRADFLFMAEEELLHFLGDLA